VGENSAIEWTHHTWNPWIGCTETSPACDHCYARELSNRRGWVKWGAGEERKRTKVWKNPDKWNAEAAEKGIRYRVFCLSLGDWADAEVPDSWRDEIEAKIDATPNLDWLLLSKRHDPVLKWCRGRAPKPNVRIGFTVENNEWANIRLSRMAHIARAGWKTFVSYEPALGPVNWDGWLAGTVQWLICGGESGRQKRPMDVSWARAARDASKRNHVPFFMKQIDKVLPIPADLMIREFPA
jgi:protein gp37